MTEPQSTPTKMNTNSRPPMTEVKKKKPRMGLTFRLGGGERNRRSRSAPADLRRRRRLLEDHFRVEDPATSKTVVLPGLPKHEDDWARDAHDFFNLIVLIPVVVLNIMNWNWDKIFMMSVKNYTLQDVWVGHYFLAFFYTTILYFCVDLIWIICIPSCVKSPVTIIQHHIATLAYLTVPFFYPFLRCFMGACMSVEINTWFLIARRVFNKQGFPPWVIGIPDVGLSLRIKLISILFYTTWISIRCILYPQLLVSFITNFWNYTTKYHTVFHVWTGVLLLHSCFCLLNLKWTYDLIASKMRYWRRLKADKLKGTQTKTPEDKGL